MYDNTRQNQPITSCLMRHYSNSHSFTLSPGCKLLCYPSAFNMTTGPAHWEVLLRSRYCILVYLVAIVLRVPPLETSSRTIGSSEQNSSCYGGPLGPFQLHTANFQFLNFSLRNLTFLPFEFPPFIFLALKFHISPFEFPTSKFYISPFKFHTFSLPYKTSLLNLRYYITGNSTELILIACLESCLKMLPPS